MHEKCFINNSFNSCFIIVLLLKKQQPNSFIPFFQLLKMRLPCLVGLMEMLFKHQSIM
jgi:hypothetical protein